MWAILSHFSMILLYDSVCCYCFCAAHCKLFSLFCVVNLALWLLRIFVNKIAILQLQERIDFAVHEAITRGSAIAEGRPRVSSATLEVK